MSDTTDANDTATLAVIARDPGVKRKHWSVNAAAVLRLIRAGLVVPPTTSGKLYLTDAGREEVAHARAVEFLTAAGVSPDPGAVGAAEVAIYRDVRPYLRPLTFPAPEHGECEWVTYALPFSAWDAALTREAAAAIAGDESTLAEHHAVGYEAVCRKCGEIFGPDLTYPDGSGLEHYQREDQRTECGGRGDLVGSWG